LARVDHARRDQSRGGDAGQEEMISAALLNEVTGIAVYEGRIRFACPGSTLSGQSCICGRFAAPFAFNI
jgi:hypothetical protein